MNALKIRQSALTCILSGTLSASGGGLISNWLNLLGDQDESFTTKKTPGIFTVDNFSSTATLNRSFLLATLYYFILVIQEQDISSSNSAGKMSASIRSGHAVITILQLFNFLSQQLDPSIDFFQEISYVILSVLHIRPVLKYSNSLKDKKL